MSVPLTFSNLLLPFQHFLNNESQNAQKNDDEAMIPMTFFKTLLRLRI